MSIVSTMKMTAQQFLLLGEDPPGVRLELVNGAVAVSPSPRSPHSRVMVELTKLIGVYIEQQDLGEMYADIDTIFGEFDVRRPDLLYYRKDRQHLARTTKALVAPPDLCIEIVSPSSGEIDRQDKFEQYASGGVAYYWVVDPQQMTLEGHELKDNAYCLRATGAGEEVVALPPFDDLKIPLGRLWMPDAV